MTRSMKKNEQKSGGYFGTDGIRGRANRFPMDCETALRAGRAITAEMGGGLTAPEIIVVQDTRLSGDMLVQALSAGICSAGGTPCLAGTLPTPAAAVLAANSAACAAVVVSASHNPYYDNGIKVFDGNGYKLSQGREAAIETRMAQGREGQGQQDEIGRPVCLDNAAEQYLDFLKAGLPDGFDLSGIHLVLDCANGAAWDVAPAIFKELGAQLTVLSSDPDGRNINLQCGSEHPDQLAEAVRTNRAHLGLALDGDADRLIVVDEKGRVKTGDQIIAITAQALKTRNRLRNNRVVTTVMSNMGLAAALKKMGIRHETTSVGDRNVMLRMKETESVLGGEDSGHLIFMDHHTTGDGIYAALRLLEIMSASGRALSELSRVMTVYPQQLLAVAVREKPPLEQIPEIVRVIKMVETELNETGRVLVRYSGTQPVCRVMVEGPDAEKTSAFCRRIAQAVEGALGLE